jgi:H/ACA ribonucleoprotein complex subunit 2
MGKKEAKEGKSKKPTEEVIEAAAGAKEAAAGPPEVPYESKLRFCSIIAKPLADEKLCKRVLKLCKKASKRKAVRRGVKEVVKALRKKAKG